MGIFIAARADLVLDASVLVLEAMKGIRKLMRARRGGFLAVALAYALAVQSLLTSVGLGMSAFAAQTQDGFFICSHIVGQPPAPGSDDRRPSPTPQCPFCLAAAYGAGNFALSGDAPALPAFAGLPLALVTGHFDEPPLIAQHRRTVGAPRAPPAFSI
jgi:hypothetical protein